MFVSPICKCGQIQVPLQQPQPIRFTALTSLTISSLFRLSSLATPLLPATRAFLSFTISWLWSTHELDECKSGLNCQWDKLLANRLLEPRPARTTVRKINRHAGSGWALPSTWCSLVLWMHVYNIVKHQIKLFVATVFRHICFLDGNVDNVVPLGFSGCNPITLWHYGILGWNREIITSKTVEG